MDGLQNTSAEGTQTSVEGTQNSVKTFTQDDVNRIVQERLAKEKGKENYGRHYVISHPLNDRRLIVVTAKQHRQLRKEFNVPRNYLPVDCLEKQSWYYTAGASGKDGISYREEQIRRLAFVRMLLKKAKLI